MSDLVSANQNSNNVSVLLGNGNGTFQAKRTFRVGGEPQTVVVADLDGDDKSDLLTVDGYDDTVSVLLGNGNGTFKARKTYDTGVWPGFLVLTDINGDSKGDLITGDTTDHTVSVLLGNGNGTFQAKRSYSSASDSYSIAVADFNGDGVKDLAAANNSTNNVSLLLGNGTTTTTTVTSTTTTTTTGTTTVTTDCLLAITGVSLATQADAIFGARSNPRLPGRRQCRFRGYRSRSQSLPDRCSAHNVHCRRLQGCRSCASLTLMSLPMSPLSSGSRSFSRRQPRCWRKRTNNPRWLFLCYAINFLLNPPDDGDDEL